MSTEGNTTLSMAGVMRVLVNATSTTLVGAIGTGEDAKLREQTR